MAARRTTVGHSTSFKRSIPECTTVSLIIAWFGSSTDVTAMQDLPVDDLHRRKLRRKLVNGTWTADPWRCSGLTQASAGPHPDHDRRHRRRSTAARRRTKSVVRCIRDLKARGLRVVFYPFILMDAPGFPWRGRIGFTGADVSSAASAGVASFLGSAAASQFTRDTTNLTVGYSGPALGLHLPAHDPALRQPVRGGWRRRPVPGGLRAASRAREHPRAGNWTKAGTTRRQRARDLGLSLRRRACAARHRRARRFRRGGLSRET